MKSKERDALLIEVIRAFKDGGSYTRRYDLYVIGETLISEYKDMSYSTMQKKIAALREQ